MTLLEVLALIAFGALIGLVGVICGGYLVFRSKASPGESMFVQPKGQVFSIPDASDVDAPDESEQNVLSKNELFKKIFGE